MSSGTLGSGPFSLMIVFFEPLRWGLTAVASEAVGSGISLLTRLFGSSVGGVLGLLREVFQDLLLLAVILTFVGKNPYSNCKQTRIGGIMRRSTCWSSSESHTNLSRRHPPRRSTWISMNNQLQVVILDSK